MKTVFYSWQSDTPNNNNKTFIETSINRAINEINSNDLSLDIAIDRDTKGISGTPDIVSTIFNKIEKAYIFIADISFINSLSKYRKTPNPNVLIELGYAAKTLGWDKIICIFNSEFGEIEELPFDLRFRRPLSYLIADSKNKSNERKNLSSIIKKEIYSVIQLEDENDDLKVYVKQNIDKEIIALLNSFKKIIFGVGMFRKKEMNEIFKLDIEDLRKKLIENKIMGFLVMKDWKDYLIKIEKIINQPFFIENTNSSLKNPLINIIKFITRLIILHRECEIFIDTNLKIKGYRIVNAHNLNSENPKDSYILLKEMDSEKGKVADYGIIRKYNFEKSLNYQMISSEHFHSYTSAIFYLIDSIKKYLNKTGNEFILDPLHFKIN